jgi:diaminopimelate decarboxylase
MKKKLNNYLEKFRELPTPFYFYDLDILRDTLDIIKGESEKYGIKIHYAIKANSNPRILQLISSYGFGADCVSMNEIERAISTGFKPNEIVFAGVGKADKEIVAALEAQISLFNCESIAEIEVINSIAIKHSLIANIALRINPNIEAHTHKYITTGIEESKFGINIQDLKDVVSLISKLKNINLKGIHFHVGSQIDRMSVFTELCKKINELQKWFSSQNIKLQIINAGGGLGIDYANPEKMPEFQQYFSLLNKLVDYNIGQELHAEPGRSVVAQCGSLISKVLYIKKGVKTRFVIIDAGMTDLIRPALYQAVHKIENLSSDGKIFRYDIVGPICESSDTFAKDTELNETSRGDIIAIKSAGAYGEVMASRYNLRDLPYSVFSDDIKLHL